jgi:signal transduction histidine kinase
MLQQSQIPAPKRVRLTRNFALLSAIVLVAAALGLSLFYHRWAVQQMVAEAEQSNVMAARLLANDLRGENTTLLSRLRGLPADQLAAQPEISWLAERMTALVKDASIIRVKIYDDAGRTLFSTDRKQIGTDESDDGGVISARKGIVASEFDHANTIDAFEGTITDRDVISSYVPIYGANREVTGVFEVYDDVTSFVAAINHFTIWLVAMTIGVAALANGILIAIVGRGDRLLQRQHEKSLELTRNVARAEAANKAKSEFLANISHELRTPLNAIIGFSDLILQKAFGPLGDARYVSYIGDIHDAGEHLLGIINNILDLTKIELGRMALKNQEAEPRELLRITARMMEPALAGRGITLDIVVPDDVPKLSIDSAKLKQCLLNLLSNAIKFSPDNSRVVLACRRAGPGRFGFSVADQGIGMSAEDIPIALSPFGQVDSSLSRQYEGAGLGLALAQRFSELMGGTLEIDSMLGRGTTVTITVPDAAVAGRHDVGTAVG